jgi:hypothetical protein
MTKPTRCSPSGKGAGMSDLLEHTMTLAVYMKKQQDFPMTFADRMTYTAHMKELTDRIGTDARRIAELEAEQAKAWGIEFCCNGNECGCMGQPINPPPWWEDMSNKIAELEGEVERLRETQVFVYDTVGKLETNLCRRAEDVQAKNEDEVRRFMCEIRSSLRNYASIIRMRLKEATDAE